MRRGDPGHGTPADHLGGPDGVLVVDETGDPKKGSTTVGTQRQYTWIAGRIVERAGRGYPTYAGQVGHAMIDRDLHLPRR